jgi:hypothetical protein
VNSIAQAVRTVAMQTEPASIDVVFMSNLPLKWLFGCGESDCLAAVDDHAVADPADVVRAGAMTAAA